MWQHDSGSAYTAPVSNDNQRMLLSIPGTRIKTALLAEDVEGTPW